MCHGVHGIRSAGAQHGGPPLVPISLRCESRPTCPDAVWPTGVVFGGLVYTGMLQPWLQLARSSVSTTASEMCAPDGGGGGLNLTAHLQRTIRALYSNYIFSTADTPAVFRNFEGLKISRFFFERRWWVDTGLAIAGSGKTRVVAETSSPAPARHACVGGGGRWREGAFGLDAAPRCRPGSGRPYAGAEAAKSGDSRGRPGQRRWPGVLGRRGRPRTAALPARVGRAGLRELSS